MQQRQQQQQTTSDRSPLVGTGGGTGGEVAGLPSSPLLPSSLPSSPLPLLFDRVFVDVPCSGDGTLRKAPELKRVWSKKHALALAPLQAQLLRAALR